MKQKLVLVLIILFSVSALFAASELSEYVFLKNGKILKGKILDETEASVRFRQKDGSVRTIKSSEILRILYTEIYLGKVTVNKTDGTVFEAYMVYEDRLDYTFRTDINKPEEFKVPRADVLSISRSNPTNLAGRPDETKIELQWRAPLTPPEKYNIYMKNKQQAYYKLIGSTRSTNYSVKSLEKKSSYYFIVKGVDENGTESLPSNEIKMVTNIPPYAPGGISEKEFRDTDGKLKLKLTWDKAEDPDGEVKEYSVYSIIKKKFNNLGKTGEREYIVQNYDPEQDADYYVASIDDNGDECDRPVMDSRTFGFQALAGWAFPVERSGELLEPDLDMGLMAEYRFYSLWELDFYAVAAYSYFSHAGSFPSTQSDALKMSGGWLGLMASYDLSESFSLNIKLLPGYVKTTLESNVWATTESQDPGLWCVIEGRFYMYQQFFVSMNISYNRVFYTGDDSTDLSAGIGLGFCF